MRQGSYFVLRGGAVTDVFNAVTDGSEGIQGVSAVSVTLLVYRVWYWFFGQVVNQERQEIKKTAGGEGTVRVP